MEDPTVTLRTSHAPKTKVDRWRALEKPAVGAHLLKRKCCGVAEFHRFIASAEF